jgi:hypothetical protein
MRIPPSPAPARVLLAPLGLAARIYGEYRSLSEEIDAPLSWERDAVRALVDVIEENLPGTASALPAFRAEANAAREAARRAEAPAGRPRPRPQRPARRRCRSSR